MKRIDEFDHIKELAKKIAAAVNPLRIYLFGSFAEGRNNEDSDYDFYVVMSDDCKENPLDIAGQAYCSARHIKKRPIDVLIEKISRFNEMKNVPISVEYDVYQKGVLLYGY